MPDPRPASRLRAGARAALRLFLLGVAVVAVQQQRLPAADASSCPAATTITWDGGAGTGSWHTAANWSGDRLPGAADHVCIAATTPAITVVHSSGTTSIASIRGVGAFQVSGGTLSVTDTAQVSAVTDVTLSGGAFSGSATVEVAGTFTWSGGTMSGTGTTRVLGGGRLLLNNGGEFAYLDAWRVVDNAGTFTWATGNGYGLYAATGSVIRNAGLFEVTTYGTLYNNSSSTQTQPKLHNLPGGVLRKHTGTSNWTVAIPVDNDGAVEATAGAVRLTGGDAGVTEHTGSFQGGVEFGSGTYSLVGASLDGARLAGAYLRLGGTTTVPVGGTFTMAAGTLGGAGTLQVAGTLTWSGGSMADGGTTQVVSGGRLLLNAGEWTYLDPGRVIDNAGTFTWATTGGYGLYAATASAIRNSGLFEVTSYGTLYNNSSSTQPQPKLHNLTGGVVRKHTGASTWTVAIPIDNDGAMEALAGAARLTGGDAGVTEHAGSFKGGVEFGSGTFSLHGASLDGARLAGAHLRVGSVTSIPAGATFTMASGTLGGTGTLEVAGTLAWSGGTMAGTGTTQVVSGGRLLLNAGEWTYLDAGRTIDNAGTVTWATTGGYGLYAGAGSVIRNAGLFEVSSYGTLYNNAASGQTPPKLHNVPGGLVRKHTSTSTWTVAVPVDNDGDMEATAGVTRLTGGDAGVITHTGTFRGGVEFGSGTYSLHDASLDGARLAGASFKLGGTTTIPAGGTFTMASGTLGGTGTLKVAGTLTWTGGYMSDAGTTHVVSGGRLLLNAGEWTYLEAGRTIDNEGTFTWATTGGYGLYAATGSLIRNAGLLEVTSYGTLYNNVAAGQPSARLHNVPGGVVRKQTSVSTWTVAVPVDNDGTMEATAGVTRLTGGDAGVVTHTGSFKGGVEFGSGTYSLDGALLDGARLAGAYLKLGGTTTVPAGGTFTMASGTLGGTGTIAVAGTLTWTGGYMSDAGTTQVLSGGRLLLNAGEWTYLNPGRVIDNAGTFTWATTGGYGLYAYQDALIRNSGLLDVTSYGTLYNQAGSGMTPPKLHNLAGGVVRKQTSTSTWTVAILVENDGAIEATAGVVRLTGGDAGVVAHSGSFKGGVEFGSGTFTLNGAALDGARLVGATLRLGGTTTVPAGGTFAMTSGTLGGTGTIEVAGTLTWTGGSMSDAGTTKVLSGGRLLLNAGEFTYLNPGRVIDNAGTFTWATTGGYGLYAYQDAVIRNSGLIEVTSYGTLSSQAGSGMTPPKLHNLAGGVVRKQTSTSTWTVGIPVENDGAIEATAGVVRLSAGEPAGATHSGAFGAGVDLAGGTYTLDGATLPGGRLVGAVLRVTAATVPTGTTFTMSSGTLGGTGTVAVDGTLAWSGGRMSDAGTTHVRTGGRLLLNNGGEHVPLDAGRAIVNDGLFTWAPVNGYGLYAGAGSTVHNAGRFEAAVGGTFYNQAAGGTPPLLLNTGTLVKSGTAQLTFQGSVDNQGSIRADAGTLVVNGNLLNYSALRRTLTGGEFVVRGTLRVDGIDVATNAARVVLDGAAASFVDASSQQALRNLTRNAGNGDLVVTGRTLATPGSLTNAGRVTVGAGGQLTVPGGYTQGSGVTTLAVATSRLAAAATLSGGTLTGAGTVDSLANQGGTVDPSGTLTVTGAYDQAPAATLAVAVTATGTDRLAVGGAATLDGTLSLRTDAGLAQADGDRHPVVDHGARAGRFATVAGAASTGLVYVVEHDPASVVAVVRPASARDTGGAVAVAGGAAYVTSRDVTLTVTPGAGAVDMRVANDKAPAGAYQPVAESLAWTLADLDGTRAVHVQFRDAFGNESSVVVDTVVLDRRAPVATVQPPAAVGAPVVVLFDEPVSGATTANVVLRFGTTMTPLDAIVSCTDAAGAAVDCATGAVRRVLLQPGAPLLPGATYTVVVNPDGAPSWIVDRAGTRAATTAHTFTAPA